MRSYKELKKTATIVYSEDYEGLDGSYSIEVDAEGNFGLSTPRGHVDGRFDENGNTPESEYQEVDIERWIDHIGEWFASGKPWDEFELDVARYSEGLEDYEPMEE